MQPSIFARRNVLHTGICRHISYSASQKWWLCCCLWMWYLWRTPHYPSLGGGDDVHSGFCGWRLCHSPPQGWPCRGLRLQSLSEISTMRHASFGGGCVLHSGFCRPASCGASPKWWQRGGLCDLRGIQPLRHDSSSRWGSVLHPSFCRQWLYSAASKWWHGGGMWKQSLWAMRHSTFRWGGFIHPSFCWWASHSPAPKRWYCCNLWDKQERTMQHSISEIMGWVLFICPCQLSLRARLCTTPYRETRFAARFEAWGWCCPADMLQFGRAGGLMLEGAWNWLGKRSSPRNCAWTEA